MIEIDGSYGEAGGQILRTSLGFSSITGKPIRVFNIRKGRRNPGLAPQHLTTIKAVSEVTGGELRGAEPGSPEIEFYPGPLKGGFFKFDVGTAGAISLVLQALMIPAFLPRQGLTVEIKGGTFVNWSPSIGYLENITLGILRKLNFKGEIIIKRHGFYPKGGGEVLAKFSKADLSPISFLERGKLLEIKGEAIASSDLKKARVAERMASQAKKELEHELKISPDIEVKYVESFGSGGGINLYAYYENSITGASAICERGKPSEKVALEACESFIKTHASGSPIDEHMEDQILPFMALAADKGESAVKIPYLTKHARTNIWVIEKFLPVKFEIDEGNKIISCKKIY